MAEVNGVRVTPVKKPTIPHKINKLALEADSLKTPAIKDPILAPAEMEGAKIPAEAPVPKLKMGPAILNIAVYQ